MKKFVGKALFILATATALSSCVEMANTYTQLPPGEWRAVLFLDEGVRNFSKETSKSIHQIRDKELPFVFEIQYDDAGDMYALIHNGEERIKVDDITWMPAQLNGGNDTVRIDFPLYNSFITATFNERYLDGNWFDLNRGEYRIPFKAIHGQDYRFTHESQAGTTDWSGSWQVLFDHDTDDPYRAMGRFEQEGNIVTGTFQTETGDYRYLEGNVVEDQLFLSVFDGSHAFLFRASQDDEGKATGIFRSGKHYLSNWTAKRSEENWLKSASELTYLKEGYDRLEFEFETPDGKILSPDSEEYRGKGKIIQIMGTWCPNCKDETLFLREFLKKNPQDDIAVMALAFEKQADEAAQQAVKRYREKLDVPYPFAVAGSYRKSEAAKSLPALNAIISYPTLIFLDKNNQVKHIHTGFNGPATPGYEQWPAEFEQMLQDIKP